MKTIKSDCTDAELSAAVDYGAPIALSPDYTVNKAGDVYRHTFKNKVCYKRISPPLKLKPKITNKGYLSVGIWVDGFKTDALVHRLVMLTFGGDPPAGHEVAHRNGIRADPRFENLKWATHKENQADMVQHGTLAHGQRNGNAVLTDDQAVAVANQKGCAPAHSVAAKYGISKDAVQLIWNGRRWQRTLKSKGFEIS